MSAIGILGGMGPQASARLVELIIEKTPNFVLEPIDSDFPEIILLSVPVPNFISDKTNMDKAKKILIQKTKLLEASGSTINCIACNTAHLLLPELQAVTTVPFLSIPKLVARKIETENFKKVGLLGTPNTIASKLFDDEVDESVEIIRPSKGFANQTESAILKTLSGSIAGEEIAIFKAGVFNFIEKNHLDAVILGCTELPVLFGKTNDPRIIDTLEVLSDGLLEIYFNS